jgi:tetratricopeptide (TPR) repeat protein
VGLQKDREILMHKYNPRKKNYQQLEGSLVGAARRDFLETVIKELSLREGESPKQHWLVVGPRGIGKSHLLTLLYHKVKQSSELSRLWIPVLFPEETRLESNLAKFLERAVNEIIHELKELDPKSAEAIRDKIAKTRTLPSQERDEYVCSVLAWITETTGKHILLITENLQHLLGKKLSLIEQKRLRAFLQTSDSVTLLGSATTVFNALHDHSHPFYNFFHIHRLTDLSFDEMKELIGSILTSTGRADLAERVVENEARIKALSVFTGGNPRMAVFLADILKTDVPEEMLDLMDGILDELTPYFETIFKDIPDFLEAVINTLAAFEPAQSPTEITAHLEGQSTTIRNYLKQLKDSGYVRVAFSRGRSNYYCLNEYLYRIWFQMRDSGHREETRWLLELLLMLYSPATLLEEKEKVAGDCITEDEAPHTYSRLIVQAADFMVANPAYCQVIEWCVASAKVGEDKTAKTTKDKKVYTAVSELIKAEEYDKAVVAIKEYLEVNPEVAWPYGLWGQCLRKQEFFEQAIEQFKKAIDISPKLTIAYWHWGACLRSLGRFDEAMGKFATSVELDPDFFAAYGGWGDCLKRLGHYADADKKYAKAISIEPKYTDAHVAWGHCLKLQRRYAEAIEKFKQAIDIDSECHAAFVQWGHCLRHTKKYLEADKKYQQAIAITPSYATAYSAWGCSLVAQKRYEEALAKYQKALEYEPGRKPCGCFMECLWKLKRFDEAIALFKQYRLDQDKCSTLFDYGKLLLEAGRYQEAIQELAALLKRKKKCVKAYLPYGRALTAVSDKEGALAAYLNYLKSTLEDYASAPDFQTLYQGEIQPVLAEMPAGPYIERLYTPAEAKDPARAQYCMILVLLGKLEIVREHLPALLAETNLKNKAEREALELLIFTIKAMLWINLSLGKIHESLSLTELYAAYIKSLPEMSKQEGEVRSLALGLLKLQVAKEIAPDSTKQIFLQLESDPDIPFAEVLLKVLTCISEPDSLQSQQFLSDKIIAEVVKGLSTQKKKRRSTCDTCTVSC